MSAPQTGERGEASGTPGGKPQSRRTSRRNTISEGSTSQAGGKQAIISKISLPFFANRRKGRLDVSEASIPAPQSSDISAQGQIFVSHEHSGGKVVEDSHDHPDKSTEEATNTPETSQTPAKLPRDEQSQLPKAFSDSDVAQEIAVDYPKEASAPSPTTSNTARPALHPFTQSETAVEVIAESSGKFVPVQAHSIPAIEIHRPSGTAMAAAVGITATNSANVPATPTQSALEQSPADAGTAPLNNLSTVVAAIPALANLPVDPSNVTNAISAGTSAISLPLPPPGLSTSGKGGKKKRMVRKTRKLLLRKRLLAIIIGRDLADVVHPQLKADANVAGGLPLRVDGPSDLLNSYTDRTERKRDFRRRQLDQKIAAARIHAEAEEIHRCRICRGLTRTMYLRRYHRLQLKRDRPDMNIFDRRAAAMARVAVFRCKCNRRLLGVENEVTVRDPVPTQHLRAPAAIEIPLSGVDEAQQR
ncbi:hypothetical protein, variant 2 [Phialophora macrospora]|uniref:Uncharacterized protein n=1 Tax=Phialophora macrospora TaxID=1851006 RepID=A0A0D2D1X5_9EURO|nr:hypothetical protein PV04_03614 [Phialophora macrospora]KIW71447.1 hypothetical protein, variant 1 [Phialophora macrospora]KIW71448.1 hypothetical protein, variant 2 [Phialophora macrospora]